MSDAEFEIQCPDCDVTITGKFDGDPNTVCVWHLNSGHHMLGYKETGIGLAWQNWWMGDLEEAQ